MSWYSISINPDDDHLFTLVYTRSRALLVALLAALKRAGYTSASEEPVEGWVCGYCGEVSKGDRCRGCGAWSPVPTKEEE